MLLRSYGWLKMFIDPKEHKNIVYLQKAISYPFMLVKDQEHKRNSTPLLELKVMAACFSMYGHYQVYIEKGW